MAGRVELVISTLSAYNIFWTSVFPLPSSVTEMIDKMCQKFIWGDTNEKKRLHLISWDQIFKPRMEGGLGTRSTNDWCEAGTMKNLWSLAAKKDSLWVRWVHGKYLRNESIWTYKPGLLDSWLFKQLLCRRDIVHSRASWKLGSGTRLFCGLIPGLKGIFLLIPWTEDAFFTLAKEESARFRTS